MRGIVDHACNQSVAGPPVTKKRLGRERLEERILNLLSSQNMWVPRDGGTREGPLATPVRYFHLDFALMFSTAPGSPKMRNLAADPRVSVGVFAPLVGQASSRGVQLFGRARVLSEGDSDFEHYWAGFSAGSPTMPSGRVPLTNRRRGRSS